MPRQLVFGDNVVNAAVIKDETHLNICGLVNVKADAFLAVFSITQVGSTTSTTDSLMELRLTSFHKEIVDRKIDSIHQWCSSLTYDLKGIISYKPKDTCSEMNATAAETDSRIFVF